MENKLNFSIPPTHSVRLGDHQGKHVQ